MLPRIGFVVSRRTGSAVVRNQVRRRLRHIARARLDRLSADAPGAALVVRVKPGAALASTEQLASGFDRALDLLIGKRAQP
jgi:ribonuclease P protein component